MKSTCRALAVAMILIFSAGPVPAAALFAEADLKDIHLVSAGDGVAVVRTTGGRTAEVRAGDSIGKGEWKVVEIERNLLVIEKGKTRTRMHTRAGYHR